MEEKIEYKVVYKDAHRHFVELEMTISGLKQDKLQLQLPAWRPGRYQLADFAKNIQRFAVYGSDGTQLSAKKLTKDLWEVDCAGQFSVKVEYNYYANELNAGSTFVDEKQLYVNPINCFLYVPEWIDKPATVELDIPKNWDVATGMISTGKHTFSVKDFHE
ncbi:MAG: putative metalloprotease with PDZ domain, partial [Bacteroidia bacterium]